MSKVLLDYFFDGCAMDSMVRVQIYSNESARAIFFKKLTNAICRRQANSSLENARPQYVENLTVVYVPAVCRMFPVQNYVANSNSVSWPFSMFQKVSISYPVSLKRNCLHEQG